MTMMMMVMMMVIMMMMMVMMMMIVMMVFPLTQAKMISLFCIFCYVLYTDCSNMNEKKFYKYLRITLRQPVKQIFQSLLDLIAIDFILRDEDKNYHFGEFMEIY